MVYKLDVLNKIDNIFLQIIIKIKNKERYLSLITGFSNRLDFNHIGKINLLAWTWFDVYLSPT